MNISELCIRRPVFASVLSIFILLIGLTSYSKLSTKEYPDIEKPVVSIECVYDGASPELMETKVTNIIEYEISGIEGIETITAKNEWGKSSITIDFTLETDLDTAINDVRAKVSAAARSLPKDMDPPIVSKLDNGVRAVIYLALYSDQMNLAQITDYAKRYIAKRLEVLSGVSQIEMFASQFYKVQIEPKPDLLKLHNVTIADIKDIIVNQTQNIPVGSISGGELNMSLVMDLDMPNVEEFANLIIKKTDNYLLRLKDIADVKLGVTGHKTLGRYKGKNSIIIAISKQPQANPIVISQLVQNELNAIKKNLPDGLIITVAFDTAKFINASIRAIYTTIFEAIILVVIVILIFLQSFRSSFIPVVTIPISLIGTFALMLMFGYSINTFTLLAMILAIGLVVDDAIVMMENIYRYIEQGMNSIEAAIVGSKEIMFAVLTMTMTLVAVFLPVGFMSDFIGKFFNEFAWTLAFSVVISGFISLTLSPMMCSLILKKHPSATNRFFNYCSYLIDQMHLKYHALLIKAINLKKYLVYILIGLVILGSAVTFFIRQELLPLEDRGYLFIPALGPDGSNFEYTKKYVDEVEKILSVNKNINAYASFIMEPTSSFTFADLKPWDERSVSQMEIAEALNKRIFSIPGVMAFAVNPPSIDTGHDSPVLLVLKGYVDYKMLDQVAQNVMAKMRQYPQFVNINKDIKLNDPAIRIDLNRDKVAFYNVDAAKVARLIQENFVPITIHNGFRMDNESYSVEISLADQDKIDASAFEKLYVANRDGTMIPLLSLIDYEYTTQPKSLNHYNKLRSVTVTANLNWGVGLGSVVFILEKIAQETITDNDMAYEFAGEIKDMQKSSRELYIIFILAILFIYFILAAQFESFLDSAIILCSVPFAIVGALLTLFLIGGSLNIYSKIGLITLIGLITKNAILIVEFTNQKLKQGLDLEKAVIEASSTRLRPIMMTTLAMIVGAIPLALATGPGAISRNEIGWVIVGGLAVGTIFTLFVIPVICIIVKGYKLKITGK
jgi:multidrug efflux pump